MHAEFVENVEANFQTLLPRMREMSDRFYAQLFARVPGLRVKFPADLTETKRRFGSTIDLIVRHARSHEALRPFLLEIGHLHAAWGMQPDHYALTRDVLLEIMGEMLGQQWTEHNRHDWNRAITYATAVMSEGMCEPTLMYS